MRSFRRHGIFDLRRAYHILRQDGSRALFRKIAHVLHEIAFPRSYERWIARYDTLNQGSRHKIIADIAQLRTKPTISIIMPVCAGAGKCFKSTLNSVETQLYPYWELCLAVGHSALDELREELDALEKRENRIRIARSESSATWADQANRALTLATGDFVAPLDVGDTLAEDALYWVAREARDGAGADLIFSDEDTIEGKAHRVDPWFKPDWNPALMLACNAFGRLGAYRRSLVQRLGGFRVGFDGAEEYDLVLRCAAATEVNRIRHVARVLYHRGATIRIKEQQGKSSNEDAGARAVAHHLAAEGIAAKVSGGNGEYQLTYALPIPHPRVSVIIATTARPDIAEPCFTSLLQRTTYDNLEILLLVNRSVLDVSERADFLKRIAEEPRVRVVDYPDCPFNYSAVNNFGAAQASGNILCFLNDDTEIVTADWLEILVSRVSLPQLAAAGPMLYYPDDTIQHAGVVLGLSGIAGHACLHEPRGSRGYFGRACLEQDVSCVTAACMAIRADVFRRLGGFDENMPLAYNDVDLCLRLRSAGWRIIWTPAAELVHRESASLGRHDQGPRAEQYAHDVTLMRQRWGPLLQADPFYNVNFGLERGYGLAFPPRHMTKSKRRVE
jgi:O-antigen biosynthesis protein